MIIYYVIVVIFEILVIYKYTCFNIQLEKKKSINDDFNYIILKSKFPLYDSLKNYINSSPNSIFFLMFKYIYI